MFQLLTTIQGICVFQETDVILADLRHHVLRCVDLAQSELVVISVVQHVDQICEERMDLLKLNATRKINLQTRKLVENQLEPLDYILLSELHLSHIESLNTLDLETTPSDRHQTPGTQVSRQWESSSASSTG